MHQTVDAFFDFDERAEIRHVADPALHHRPHAVAVLDRGPGIRLQLLESQRNAALLRVDLEHHRLHLIARLHHLRGMLHAPRPGHLADVDQPFDAGSNSTKAP